MGDIKITVHTTLGEFSKDCKLKSKRGQTQLRNVIREGIRVGNSVAKDFARKSAGRHGKHYPRAFTTEMLFTAGNFYQGTYGPDAALPQGGMSFEWGSRNQPPHLDLNKSADLIGPAMPGEVRAALDRIFW